MLDSKKVISDRIKRLEKQKQEYEGRDNGFFNSLIKSQKELLNKCAYGKSK